MPVFLIVVAVIFGNTESTESTESSWVVLNQYRGTAYVPNTICNAALGGQTTIAWKVGTTDSPLCEDVAMSGGTNSRGLALSTTGTSIEVAYFAHLGCGGASTGSLTYTRSVCFAGGEDDPFSSYLFKTVGAWGGTRGTATMLTVHAMSLPSAPDAGCDAKATIAAREVECNTCFRNADGENGGMAKYDCSALGVKKMLYLTTNCTGTPSSSTMKYSPGKCYVDPTAPASGSGSLRTIQLMQCGAIQYGTACGDDGKGSGGSESKFAFVADDEARWSELMKTVVIGAIVCGSVGLVGLFIGAILCAFCCFISHVHHKLEDEKWKNEEAAEWIAAQNEAALSKVNGVTDRGDASGSDFTMTSPQGGHINHSHAIRNEHGRRTSLVPTVNDVKEVRTVRRRNETNTAYSPPPPHTHKCISLKVMAHYAHAFHDAKLARAASHKRLPLTRSFSERDGVDIEIKPMPESLAGEEDAGVDGMTLLTRKSGVGGGENPLARQGSAAFQGLDGASLAREEMGTDATPGQEDDEGEGGDSLISISVGGMNWTNSSSLPPQVAPAPQTEADNLTMKKVQKEGDVLVPGEEADVAVEEEGGESEPPRLLRRGASVNVLENLESAKAVEQRAGSAPPAMSTHVAALAEDSAAGGSAAPAADPDAAALPRTAAEEEAGATTVGIDDDGVRTSTNAGAAAESESAPDEVVEDAHATALDESLGTKAAEPSPEPELELEQAAAGDTLPLGWTQHEMDDGSGHLYFHNEVTGATEWERPLHAAEESAPPLPVGWEELADDAGHAFFHCDETGETSWTRPGADEHVVETDEAVDNDLMDGWTQHEMDDGSGHLYFHNETTNETVWEKPTKE